MKTKAPRTSTMYKVMYEIEDPQILAWFFVQFDDEDEPRYVSIGVQSSSITTPDGAGLERYKYIEWPFDSWIPDKSCNVLAIKVEFIGLEDWALVKMGQPLDFNLIDGVWLMDMLKANYKIHDYQTNQDIEENIYD